MRRGVSRADLAEIAAGAETAQSHVWQNETLRPPSDEGVRASLARSELFEHPNDVILGKCLAQIRRRVGNKPASVSS
jgi:hypothetical protein